MKTELICEREHGEMKMQPSRCNVFLVKKYRTKVKILNVLIQHKICSHARFLPVNNCYK